MASKIPRHRLEGPLGRDLIKTFHEHDPLFQEIAAHPQAGVYERFGEEWALSLSFTESEVHLRKYGVKKLLQDVDDGKMNAMTEEELHAELKKNMEPLMQVLEDHARRFHLSRQMALSPPPSQRSMDYYRINLKGCDGNTMAANGEDTSLYGAENTPVPESLTVLDNENLDPIENFLVDRVMNPFLDFVLCPLRTLLHVLKIPKQKTPTCVKQKYVNGSIISLFARLLVCGMANLSLAIAIGTLDSITSSKARIAVMTLFGQAFAASVQFIGPGSVPIYVLITSYFQAMVIFVGTTSDNKVS